MNVVALYNRVVFPILQYSCFLPPHPSSSCSCDLLMTVQILLHQSMMLWFGAREILGVFSPVCYKFLR